MVLVTALLGGLVAGETNTVLLIQMLVGTLLATAGSSIFNQLLERRTDARMPRTEMRPLPAGRLSFGEVFIVGSMVTIFGLVLLLALPSGPLAAIVTGLTFVIYVAVYTPLKRLTWLNTFVGALPGAAPPLIGWAAVRGTLDWASVPLFAILFFWQIPHFLAIAWMYRNEYRDAQLKMLPCLDPTGIRTTRAMILNTVFLIAASLAPAVFGAGWLYLIGATLLGAAFLWLAIAFGRSRNVSSARAVLKASLIYLPLVLLLLFCDRLI
jgi:protoheme IX farnesyltransferase